jgi:ribosomal protein S18 acetylase RimI-like enzyme
MKIAYRMGTREDLPVITGFLDKREYFPGYAGDESPGVVRPVIAQSFRDNLGIFDDPRRHPVFVAEDRDGGGIAGYMVLVNGVEESITGDMQIVIYDFFVRVPELRDEIMDRFLAFTLEASRMSGHRFVTTELRPNDRENEDYFASRGFHVEMNRIVKRVGRYTFDTPRQRQFAVRPAGEMDRDFILLLNAENSPFLIPTGRECDTLSIRASYFDTYTNMKLKGNPNLLVLIGEDVNAQRHAGYIMVKTEARDLVTGKLLAYLYDISVHKDYWGTFLGQRLVREAENRLAERDVEYFVGDTAENNPRPLRTALKTLQFRLFSRRWVRVR